MPTRKVVNLSSYLVSITRLDRRGRASSVVRTTLGVIRSRRYVVLRDTCHTQRHDQPVY